MEYLYCTIIFSLIYLVTTFVSNKINYGYYVVDKISYSPYVRQGWIDWDKIFKKTFAILFFGSIILLISYAVGHENIIKGILIVGAFFTFLMTVVISGLWLLE
jgi:hypothetical protein